MITPQQEFEKNSELKEEDLQHLKEWVKKQPHLPELTDCQLILLLHSCYYRLEPTKVTIDNYCTVRTHAPELFSNRDLSSDSLKEAAKTTNNAILPGVTPEGYTVIYSRLQRTEPELYVLSDALKLGHMVEDVIDITRGTSNGFVVIFDMKGISLGHVGRLTMSAMKKHLFYVQEAMPVRMKGIHLLNTVPFIDMIMNMFKPFMKSELLNMIHFHQPGSEEIYKYVPKSMIPSCAGGDEKSLKELHEETLQLIESNKTWFEEDEKRKVDETKRIGKGKNINELFGMDGSFKKLNID